MAYKCDPATESKIKALIVKQSNFREGTDIFNYIHDYFVKTLRRADSAFGSTKHEIDTKVEGLAEKLVFHGFLQESKSLKMIYSKYINTSSGEDDMKNKVAVMDFLFAMSRSPTTNLALLPEGTFAQEDTDQEDIDWGTYLMEGIEVWKPNFDDSDDLSDLEDEVSIVSNPEDGTDVSASRTILNDPDLGCGSVRDQQIAETYEKCRRILMETCQHTWFTSAPFRDLPHNDDIEACAAIRWEDFIYKESHGLLGGPQTKLLSEYKVLREIIWQLVAAPHNSAVFTWSGNEIVVNDGVSIPSLRPLAFKGLVSFFLPDIRKLHELRAFQRRVMADERAPHTFRGYAEAAMNIVRLANACIATLEAEIARQETTVTMISLGNELASRLQDVRYLHRVYCAAILDYDKEPRHTCCMHLLSVLYAQMRTVGEKRQMDVVVALYLDAAYKYVRIIEEWFRNDRLIDAQKEFPLAFFATKMAAGDAEGYSVLEPPDGGAVDEGDRKEAFERFKCVHRSTGVDIDEDPLVALIKKEVMQIGRQLRLFSLLGKLHLLHETNFSIYDEWRESVLESLRDYGTICEPRNDVDVAAIDEGVEINDDLQVGEGVGVVALGGKYSTEFDLLEYCADTSDGFLMSAFHDVFYPEEDDDQQVDVKITYHELQAIGSRSLPVVAHVVADALSAILHRKYSNCGRLLKEVFVRDHHLGEHTAILAKVYLFDGDVIFPFYRRVFEKIESNASWGNDIWLTYDLQDVLADAHPRLHERVRVGVRPGWETMLADPLRTCTLIDVQYHIEWPIDIIVTPRALRMYRDLFYLILKIKWALHTLNHLNYTRSQQRRRKEAPRAVRALLQRLEVLRFGYINIFAAIQHYILGYVYRVCRERYEREFEAAADLEALVVCHNEFIDGFHRLATKVRDYQAKAYGFDRALYSVRQLRQMWLHPGDVLDKMLQKTEDSLRECHRNIFDVISVQVYD